MSCSFSLLYACSQSGKSGQVGSLVDSLVSPEYPGGVTAMIKFISQNLEYPKACQENGTQGRVGVRFIVGRDGTISNVNVLESVDPFWDKEAVRVIKAMPRWKPGMHKGKPVSVSYVVPVNFKLQ